MINNQSKFLLLMLIAISLQIALMTIFSNDGGVSPDSANYLRFALSDGFYVKDLFASDGKIFFAVWPMGYPLLIKALAHITPFDILIISKLLNVILIFLTCLFLVKIFPENGFLYAMLFLSDSFVKISYMSWSETPFSLLLVIITVAIYQYYNSKKIIWLFWLFLSCSALFLMRYIGLFILLPIAIFGLFSLLKKEYKSFFSLLLTGILTLFLAALYLWINYIKTGYLTGIKRYFNKDSNSDIFWQLLNSQFQEIIPIIFVILFYLLLSKIFFKKLALKPENKREDKLWLYFLIVGFCYWITIVLMRWIFDFDPFGNRLLAPSTLLFSCALLAYFLQYENLKKHLFYMLILMISFMTIQNILPRITQNKEDSFIKIWQKNHHFYQSIKDDSIIIFGNLDMLYYKNNIQTPAPFPYYMEDIFFTNGLKKGEDLNNYATRICNSTIAKNIYVVNSEEFKARYPNSKLFSYDKSKEKNIILLKECH